MAKRPKRQPKRAKKVAPEEGIAHIKATFNNTIITITDPQGNPISWSSGGRIGFTGSKKSTPYAAQLAAREAAERAMDIGMRSVEAWTKGPGSGKEAAVRALSAAGLKVTRSKDVTPVPHGGCRGKKRRRV
ncbi:30S ribosomal protein S11 [bacterium]|nr:MAG: 30S ribosomal protein S11 [bacterium]